MSKDHKHTISRRKFLGQSCAALGYTTMFSSLINLKAIASASMNNSLIAQSSGDYKALVCLMLNGGNDSYNMLIPRGNAEYGEYAATRSNLAIPQQDILPINPFTTDGREFGLHPSMGDMQSIFENQDMAFLCNVGTLVEPATKEEIYNQSVQTPLGLFSHSDQQQQWHTGRPHERSSLGWGGRIADLTQSMNSNDNISMNVSLQGINLFQRGLDVIPYSISPSGSMSINGYGENNGFDQLRTQALDAMMDRDYQDIFKNTYINTIKASNDASNEFQEAIDSIPEFSTLVPEGNFLAEQLQMVGKTIAARDTLGFSRQIFYVQLGGWDHHDELLINHAGNLGTVNEALKYFYDLLQELNVFNDVTTFNISDFSRTLTSNGNGTDHAWGGNTFAMGGSVLGRDMYGEYPTLALGSQLDLYDGVLIPTMAADLYMAELALWFGVPYSDLSTIFPNIGNFFDTGSNTPPIGFMNI